MSERQTIAETFKREVIWTEADVGYLSKQHTPDPHEANRAFGEAIGQPDWLDDEEGPDECHLRWLDDESERQRLAAECGIAFDPDEDYFQECGAERGEPFWKVEG